METTPQSRPWFVILPILLLMVIAFVAPWRRLAVNQARLTMLPPHGYAWALREQGVKAEQLPESDPGEEQTAVRKLSAAHPQDYQIQLAYSLLAEWSHALNTPDDRVKRLDALAGEFPSRPTVYAHMLRYETERVVRVRRETEYQNVVQQIDKDDIKVDADELRPPQDLKKHLDEFDRYAAAGEKLEPQNAYFSMMRAIGYFAALRDDEAIDSIIQASKKTTFEDHLADELEADWRLGSEAFGDNSAALRAAIQGGVPSPHLDQLAALGRTAAAVAIKLELANKPQDGLALRMAMAHCGKLMRVHSHSIPGAIVGCNITHGQIFRPGGAKLIVEDVNLSAAEREQQRLNAYYKFLTQYGQASEVAWTRRELEQIGLVTDIQKSSADASISPYGKHGLQVTSWWLWDYVVLLNLIALILPTVVAAIASIKKTIRPGSLLMLLTGAYALIISLVFQSQGAIAMTALRFQFYNWMLHNKGAGDAPVSTLTDRIFDPGSVHSVVVVLSLVATMLVFALLYRTSRKTDIIYVDTIKIDFVPIASGVCCLLLVIYMASLQQTVRQEQQLHSELRQVMINEGRFMAPMVGKTWPD